MNCKPGDLAFTVKCRREENNGHVVRVIRRHVNNPEWNYLDIPCWWCESTATLIWEFPDTGEVRQAQAGPIPDRNLRPILPPPELGLTKQPEAVTA